jgi:hypothetical protein
MKTKLLIFSFGIALMFQSWAKQQTITIDGTESGVYWLQNSDFQCPSGYFDQGSSNGQYTIGQLNTSSSCAATYNYVAAAKIDHPGFKNYNILSVKLKFQIKRTSGTNNHVYIGVASGDCVNASSNHQKYSCITGSAHLTSFNQTSASWENKTISISPREFNQDQQYFNITFNQGFDLSKIQNVSCQITYDPSIDFNGTGAGMPCSHKDWWLNNLFKANNSGVLNDLAIDKTYNNVFYKNTVNGISFHYYGSNGPGFWNLTPWSGNNCNGHLAVNSSGQVFFKTNQNSINALYWDNTTNSWSKSTLNNASGFNVKGDLVINSNDQIFYRTTNNAINCIYWNGTAWTKSVLNNASGNNCAGSLVVNSGDQVFFRTTNNKINCLYWTGTHWSKSTLNNASGSNVGGQLAVNSNDQVFYKTTNNRINCIYWNGTSWSKSILNNASGNNVRGGLTANGTDKVFYRTTNNKINALYWYNNRWSKASLNSSVNCTSSSIVKSYNNSKVYFIDNKRLKYLFYGSSVYCDPGKKLGGNRENGKYASSFPSQPVPFIALPKTPSNLFEQEGVQHVSGILEPQVYPNPSKGIFTVKIGDAGEFTYRIFNSQGNTILNEQNGKNSVTIDLSNQPNGIYYMEIQSDHSYKLVKLQKI